MASYGGYPIYTPDQQEGYYGNGNQLQFQQYPPPVPVVPYGMHTQNPFGQHNPQLNETVPVGPGIPSTFVDNYDSRTYEGSNISMHYPMEGHRPDIQPAVETLNFYPPRALHDGVGTVTKPYSISGTPVSYSTPRLPFRGRGTSARGSRGAGYGRGGTVGSSFTGGANSKTNESAESRQSKSTQYYCDICKISCIGPLAFRDHQAGQRHKKRAAQNEAAEKLKNAAAESDESVTAKVTLPASRKRKFTKPLAGVHELRCALCDVGCTGVEAYTAHINGKLHQKTLRLHRNLGKPIPSTDNPLVPNEVAEVVSKEMKKSEGDKESDVSTTSTENGDLKHVDLKSLSAAGPEKSIVGEEYLETDVVANSKATHYRCKLCDCQFSADAKDLHLKGRRHRLQYKQKVDPSLDIQPKSSNIIHRKYLAAQRQSDLSNEHSSRSSSDFLPPFNSPLYGNKLMNFLGVPPLMPGGGVPGARLPLPPPLMGPPQSNVSHPSLIVENRLVMNKHASILPTATECKAVKVVIGVCEHALKRISDNLIQNATKEKADAATAPETPTTKPVEDKNSDDKKDDVDKSKQSSPVPDEALRLLRGVVRVGALGEGLLLHSEHYGDLILVCSEWPTVQLVQYLMAQLPGQMPESEHPLEFEFQSDSASGQITIVAKPKASSEASESGPRDTDWPTIRVRIQLTSPAIYAEDANKSVTNSESADATQGEKQANAQPSAQQRTTRSSVSVKVSSATLPKPASSTTADQQTPLASVSPAGPYHHAVLGGARGEPIARRRCLDAFEAINQAKWFQSIFNKPGLAVVSRVVRDFIIANTLWSGLNEFALLAFLDRLQSTDNYTPLPRTRGGGPHPYAGVQGHRATGPARLLRRFFEVMASGLLLSIVQVGDEKTLDSHVKSAEGNDDEEESSRFYPIDLFCRVPLATREQITVDAQTILRQIAFRQLYKVLRMTPLYSNYPRNSQNDEENGNSEPQKISDTEEDDAGVSSAKKSCQEPN